ncbi:hypothetical protein GCM10010207_51080 [Streptomyces atratus]|nr:hypothetical protein GCM10010207_51080 [Streptomyces atratus]
MLRRIGAPIVDVWCADVFVVMLIVRQGPSRLAYCIPHSELAFCSSSERLGPGLGVGAVVISDGDDDVEADGVGGAVALDVA